MITKTYIIPTRIVIDYDPDYILNEAKFITGKVRDKVHKTLNEHPSMKEWQIGEPQEIK